jgi:ATP-dependent RNA helicase DeaD
LSLVVHVELPRDAETLQHRSGRTGRAGRKGRAVLIVPYPRRKRVEAMLRDAGVKAGWTPVPTPEAIRAQDRERLLAALLAPVESEAEDAAIAERLLAERTPEAIATALVRAHRARLPEPEELMGDTPDAREAGHRPGFDDVVWFRMDIGKRHNADPRWILPLLCRRGHISRAEVGAIRIGPAETRFQVPRGVAGRFMAALARTAGTGSDEEMVRIEPVPDAGGPPPRHKGGAAPMRAAPRGRPNGPPPHAARKGKRAG